MDEPLHRLPASVTLSLAEASLLLRVVDIAITSASSSGQRTEAETAARVLTRALWADLGRILDEEEDP